MMNMQLQLDDGGGSMPRNESDLYLAGLTPHFKLLSAEVTAITRQDL